MEEGGEPIAVVGLACRFPGAPDAESYWRLLCERPDVRREVPADRWDVNAWYDADPKAPGKISTRYGYFLDGVSGFDPLFFGISPREAAEMDPQQRLALELAWEALDDAGLPAPGLKGSRTGVFMGAIWHDYAERHLRENGVITSHSGTGQALNIVSNRMSYVLGLHGPSLTVDAACGSSLVALHLACQSLRAGESTLALAGGVNLYFSPDNFVRVSKFGGLARDARCKAFAAGADGFGRGDGAGLVVLQPLSAALASGARIYCVIRGSAVNNNGATGNRMIAPSVSGQTELLRDVYARCGVPAHRVHYVEAHGTGTALGDPAEANALGTVLGQGRPAGQPLLIGSVKALIGHTEAAAGMAALIKVALSLSRRQIPPHALHGEPNPAIPFDSLRLAMPDRLTPWPGDGDAPATAGVNAFGWGGGNCHVVLEESPVGREELLPLAADSAEALLAQVEKAEALVARPVPLRDLARTWARQVGPGRHRAAFTFRGHAELAAQLRAFQQGQRRSGLASGEASTPPRVAFLCGPGGPGWHALGRELLATEPVFRARVAALDEVFRGRGGGSLVEALGASSRALAEGALTFAVQVGLAALWRSWGVEPEEVVGHGVGAVAAAYLTGALALPEAVERVCARHVTDGDTVEAVVARGVHTVVELGPDPMPGLRGESARGALLKVLGLLHVRGVPVRWEALPPPETVVEGPAGTSRPEVPGRALLLPLSARTPEALKEAARLLHARLEEPGPALGELSYSAAVHRAHLDHRLALLARSRDEAREGLAAFLKGEHRPGLVPPRRTEGRNPPLVFVFPGQGSQWVGMGRRLMAEEPVFRSALQACDAALRQFVDWSLVELLGSDDAGWLERIDQVQPALFGIQVALARLWRSWGVIPDAVVGHSMGEVAAAHVAGALGLEDAARIICRRSLLLRGVSGQGAMAVVELTLDEARAALEPWRDVLSVAASNSPRSTVLSGEAQALSRVLEGLEARGVFCRRVKVDVASHSPQMEPLREPLLQALEGLSPRQGQVPLYSTVTGEVARGEELAPAYWVRNLRDPVLLAPVVERLARDGHRLYVEVSAHPVLLPSLEQTLSHLGLEGAVLPSLRREQPEREVMLETLGGLHASGRDVTWTALHPEGGWRVRLPDYPWQRQHLWFQPGVAAQAPRQGHAVLGPSRRSSLRPGAFLWDVELGAQGLPWLKDHRVQGAIFLPTTAYLAWVLAAARSALGSGEWALEEVRIDAALTLPEEGTRAVEVLLDTGGSFQVASREPGSEEWTVHATGRVRACEARAEEPLPVEALRQRCTEPRTGEAHYNDMERRGLQYGPAFRGLREAWRRDGEALGRVQAPEGLGASEGPHPALLDAALQVLLETFPTEEDSVVPIRVRRFEVPRPGTPRWVHARLTRREGPHTEGDVFLFDEQGLLLAAVEGLTLATLPAARGTQERSLFELAWRPVEKPVAFEPGAASAPWLILQDASGVGAALAQALESWGAACVRVEQGTGLRRLGERHYSVAPGSREDFRAVLRACFPDGAPCSGVAFLWGLGTAATDVAGERAMEEAARACGGALVVVQELLRLGWREPPRLWLVTRGAWPVRGSPVTGALQAALWGFGRTVGNEHPELHCTCVDLDPVVHPEEVGVLGRELASRAEDEQVALREGARYVARLVRRGAVEEPRPEPLLPAEGRPFQVEEGGAVRLATRRPPGPGEVELAVEAAAPVEDGADCAGRVSAVGAGVSGLSVGDAVVALAPGALASHAVADARFVVRRPPGLSAAEACTLPSAFLTAWYALHHVARLRAGERVLIHAKEGGLGLAAVQAARIAGAEVFVTAGTPEQRELLHTLGVRHVLDLPGFVDEVKRATGGEGVDVVLSSHSGEAVGQALDVLAPDGRFLDAGRGGGSLELSRLSFRRLSYTAIDMAGLREHRPELCSRLLREVLARVESGALRPLAHVATPVSRAAGVISEPRRVFIMEDPELRLLPARPGFRVLPDAAYLITGGLGGLGLSAARWLVERGARHLLLLGRGAGAPEAQRELEAMRAQGASIEVARVDVTDARRLAEVLERRRAEGPPLRGVLHCAGVLDDGTLAGQEPAWFRTPMAPKVQGAWNLHRLTREDALDFFVLYSSMAGLLGLPGQGNYAAGNVAMDALAHYRRQQGLPALSVSWGPFRDVGLAAAQSVRGDRLASQGMAGFTPAQGAALLEHLLAEGASHVGAVDLDVRQWLESFPSTATLRVWEELMAEHRGNAPRARSGLLDELRRAVPGERPALLEGHLRQRLAQVLRIDPSRVGRHEPFRGLGLDSLLSLELRNRIEAALELKLSVVLLWTHPTLATLAPYLLEQLGLSPMPEAAPVVVVAPPPGKEEPAPAVVLAELSDQGLLDVADELLSRWEDVS